MKATLPLLLLLSATLSFAEPAAPGGASSPSEPHAEFAVPKPHAESAESAEPKPHAESAESAESKPHAESAESAEPAAPGGASSPSEPHAESAEPKPHAETAEPKPHAEPAESAEPAAPGGASSPSEPHAEPAPAGKHTKPVKVNCVNRDNPANGVTGVNCANPEKPRLGATVRLSDGSILKGTLRRRFLPADTDTLGQIRIDLSTVESISFTESHAGSSAEGARNGRREVACGAAEPSRGATSLSRVTFRNGDRLTVRFPADLKPLPFDTVIGRVFLPLPAVSRLVLEPPPASPPNLSPLTPTLIYHCTFDSPSAIARPAAGPAGKFLSGSFVPGKNGRALRVEADTPAFESMLPKGFLGPEGTIEFWAKIEGDDPRYVDGGDPLFVSLYDERGAITLLQFAANNGFARGGLGGAFMSWPFGTIPHYSWSMEYRKVLGDNWADWHHYAMSWKAGGFGDGSFAKVFVDGKPQPVLGGVDDDKLPARLADYVNHAHNLGIPWHASSTDRRRSKKPFLVDDLKIWSVAKTDFAVSNSSLVTRHSSLLYHCTFDDAQSVERPAAGPNGRVLGGTFVPGKKGNALRIPGNVPTALVDLPRGFLQPKGTIEFWSKIEDPPASYGDRGNPRFFGLSIFDDPANPGPCCSYLQFTSNDGMGMSGLCGMIYHRAMATDPQMSTHTYGPLLDDPAAWHHYAIVWDADGLPFSKASDGTPAVATIILDGRVLQTFGRNQFDKGKGLLRLPELQGKLAFPVSDTNWGFFPRPIAFLIDEFKIWSAPKTDIAISETQPCDRTITEPPKLLYHCTFDDAAGVENSAIGPKGKFLGGEFLPGKVGNALRVYADTPAAQTAFKPGDLGMRGTIEFWAKMEEATPETVFGDGGNPRFFCLWADLDKPMANPRSSYLQWSGNDGGGRSGLCAMVSGCSATSEAGWGMRRYPAFLGEPSDWHHYAVAWDENGVFGTPSVVAVYVDGKLVPTDGRNGLVLGRKFKSFLEGPVLLGFPQRENEREPAARHVPFLIDEFKIWSAPVVPAAAPPGA